MIISNRGITCILIISCVIFSSCSGSNHPKNDLNGSLTTFSNDQNLVSYLQSIQADNGEGGSYTSAPSTYSAPIYNDSITNNQEAGVDEGDIIKAVGDYFVILRKGHLYSVATDPGLDPIDSVPAYPPNTSLGTWYDEILIQGDTIIVLGYSYQIFATEINLFTINQYGDLTYQTTYYLNSHDYYSSRNYASRLMDGKLILYMPYFLGYWDDDVLDQLPAIVKLNENHIRENNISVIQDDWQRIIKSEHIFRPIRKLQNPTLHTIITCDIHSDQLICDAKAIIAEFARNYYVTDNAVYLWTTNLNWNGSYEDVQPQSKPATVYRMPIDQNVVQVAEAYGNPIDQFSFYEDQQTLHVLLQANGGGDWMWLPEYSSGELTYASIPLSNFGGEPILIENDQYFPLDNPGWGITNRFIGDYLLYGSHSETGVRVMSLNDPGKIDLLPVSGFVERIDKLGDGALIVGQTNGTTVRSDLVLTPMQLNNGLEIKQSLIINNTSQGEYRSHGYNFTLVNDNTSVFGLPVINLGNDIDNTWNIFNTSAEIIFFQTDEYFKINQIGSLEAQSDSGFNECDISCVDWYGNTRPIFYNGRIFALIAYELVEGLMSDGILYETERVDFYH